MRPTHQSVYRFLRDVHIEVDDARYVEAYRYGMNPSVSASASPDYAMPRQQDRLYTHNIIIPLEAIAPTRSFSPLLNRAILLKSRGLYNHRNPYFRPRSQ